MLNARGGSLFFWCCMGGILYTPLLYAQVSAWDLFVLWLGFKTTLKLVKTFSFQVILPNNCGAWMDLSLICKSSYLLPGCKKGLQTLENVSDPGLSQWLETRCVKALHNPELYTYHGHGQASHIMGYHSGSKYFHFMYGRKDSQISLRENVFGCRKEKKNKAVHEAVLIMVVFSEVWNGTHDVPILRGRDG